MNRRQLTSAAGSLLLLGAMRKAAFGRESSGSAVGDQARELYQRAIVLDCNLAPEVDQLPISPADLDLYRGSGLTAIKMTIGGYADSLESTLGDIALCQQIIEQYPDVFMQIRRVQDITAAKRDRKLGILLSFEGVGMLEGKLERIELFRRLGVRVMQLSYNTISPFAVGVLANPDTGLTPLGRAAVSKMNELGVAIDISHASAKTTEAVLASSSRPVLMTHAGCSAVHAHPRNKSDPQLRALAEKGGVVGIYDLPYLTASPRQPQVSDYMEHMAHALSVCGEDHVGIGSDATVQPFDTSAAAMKDFEASLAARRASGVAAPEEDRPTYVVGLNTPRRCEVIADELLKRKYPARVAEKVLGGNFVRAFGEIWSV